MTETINIEVSNLTSTKNKLLEDVIIIRPLVILLLIIYHSFIIYDGGWRTPINLEHIELYSWISKISYSFMLPMFVFIAGYIFAFQIIDQKKRYRFSDFVFKKFKRLILPSIFFSILYFFLFQFQKEVFNSKSFLIEVLSGSGHLWFLPMLFWCFVSANLLSKIQNHHVITLILLCGISVISFAIPIPFGINNALHYLFYFYLGYTIWFFKNTFKKYVQLRFVLTGLAVFTSTFIILTFTNNQIIEFLATKPTFLIHALLLCIKSLNTIFYATTGVLTFYIATNYLIKTKAIHSNRNLEKMNHLCFGIYIYQQFILMFLYFNTSLPYYAGSYWLPILSLLITTTISILLTMFTLRSKFGRLLIS